MLAFSTDRNLLYLLDFSFYFNFPKPFGLMKLSFQKVPNLVFVALRTKRRRGVGAGAGLKTPTLPPLVSCVQEHHFDKKTPKYKWQNLHYSGVPLKNLKPPLENDSRVKYASVNFHRLYFRNKLLQMINCLMPKAFGFNLKK